jgi:hypothetical protein
MRKKSRTSKSKKANGSHKAAPTCALTINPIVAMLLGPEPKKSELRERIRVACEEAGEALKPQAIHDWKKLRDGVPAKRAKVVAAVLRLPLYKVRPDIYAAPTPRAK